MNILLLSRYGELGASSRLRSYQYLPYLRERDVKITVAPLLNDSYLEAFYQTGHRSKRIVLGGYWRRMMTLVTVRRYDVLWLEKELFQMFPAFFERLLRWLRMPYVVDYDDAIFHNYDKHDKWLIRRLLGHKIDVVMRNAALVITGNDYLATRARLAGAKRVEILPTVIDINRYQMADNHLSATFTIGWIGSPTTAQYLKIIEPALKTLVDGETVRLMLIGSGTMVLDMPVERVTWSEDTEVENIRKMNVGIMPLTNTPWERGKCGYKLIQYMACGLPVIASPVGVNTDIVQHTVNGFLPHTIEEWQTALRTLQGNPTQRQQMGTAGRRIVEERYTTQITAPQLYSLLQQIGQ